MQLERSFPRDLPAEFLLAELLAEAAMPEIYGKNERGTFIAHIEFSQSPTADGPPNDAAAFRC